LFTHIERGTWTTRNSQAKWTAVLAGVPAKYTGAQDPYTWPLKARGGLAGGGRGGGAGLALRLCGFATLRLC
jgi:hypothetical protein